MYETAVSAWLQTDSCAASKDYDLDGQFYSCSVVPSVVRSLCRSFFSVSYEVFLGTTSTLTIPFYNVFLLPSSESLNHSVLLGSFNDSVCLVSSFFSYI